MQSIKRQKWFRGPDLVAPDSNNQLNKLIPKCATSVGLNTAFLINFHYTSSYNFTTGQQGQSRQTNCQHDTHCLYRFLDGQKNTRF